MPTYLVTQTLCRDRVVEVVATSEAEARHKAREGYGTIVKSSRRDPLVLLVDRAERVPDGS